MEADCFPVSEITENKPERDLSLLGQKRQGWARCGQLMTGNVNYIHLKFQDLQQKRVGVRVEVQK